MLVSEGHEQGVIDLDERNMINRVMRLGDRTADSLMTPRTRIAWLDASASLTENLAAMRNTPFSRYPVYRGDDSDVVGVLEVKTLLDELGQAAAGPVPRPAPGAVRVRIHPRDEAAGDPARGTAVAGAGGGRIRRHPGHGDGQRHRRCGDRPAEDRERRRGRRGSAGGHARRRLAAGGRRPARGRAARTDRRAPGRCGRTATTTPPPAW